ncbi:MAG TPA: site-2 protease family protein [Ktedonobacteraceae bacterium]|nr:site-2 protease family protein [Ktedonobacteraceae bacterium]
MSWNPKDDFCEYYDQVSHHIDYSDPSFYQSETPETPRSAQPVQSLDPSAINSTYTHELPSDKLDYEAETMTPYRGPSSIEGYTEDIGAEQRESAKRGTSDSSGKRKGLAGLGGLGAALSALLLKFPLLAPLLKFGWLGFSALFSVVVYSLIFGWQFAVGLVVLLFVHEMGHAMVMKLKGIPIGGMIFIPLLGAAVIMKQMPKNAKDEAEVGIAGPIAGAIASMVCLTFARQYPDTVWAPLAYFGFFINLFNLIPIVPFDGGRVLGAIDRRIWIIGFIGLVVFQIWSWINGNHSLFLLLFVILAASQLWTRRSVPNTPEARAYYDVPIAERIILGLAYFGLAAVLVLGMAISHGMMYSLGQ